MRQKHVPQRTCVGCGQLQAKRQMVRVVRTVEGPIQVDPTGKHAGRGAYLCKNARCWEIALQRSSLNRALKAEASLEEREELLRYSRLFGAESTTQSAPEADGEAGS